MRMLASQKQLVAYFLTSLVLWGASPTVAMAQAAGGRVGLVSSEEMGFTAGAYLSFALSDRFSVQPELVYAEKASGGPVRMQLTQEAGRTVISEQRTFPTMGYLDLLGMAKLHVSVFGLPMHLEAGPSASFRVICGESVTNRRFDFNTGEQLPDETVAADCDRVKRTDVALVTGIGFDISMFNIPITLDVRDHYGLVAIDTVDQGIKNRFATFTVSVQFRSPR